MQHEVDSLSDPTAYLGHEDQISDQVREVIGTASEVRVKPLDHASLQVYLGMGPIERRLRMECAQHPAAPVRPWQALRLQIHMSQLCAIRRAVT